MKRKGKCRKWMWSEWKLLFNLLLWQTCLLFTSTPDWTILIGVETFQKSFYSIISLHKFPLVEKWFQSYGFYNFRQITMEWMKQARFVHHYNKKRRKKHLGTYSGWLVIYAELSAVEKIFYYGFFPCIQRKFPTICKRLCTSTRPGSSVFTTE